MDESVRPRLIDLLESDVIAAALELARNPLPEGLPGSQTVVPDEAGVLPKAQLPALPSPSTVDPLTTNQRKEQHHHVQYRPNEQD